MGGWVYKSRSGRDSREGETREESKVFSREKVQAASLPRLWTENREYKRGERGPRE
jgi:hypothetical protein